ncbi:Uncharacterized protein Fot_44884 [Forsythia ovata]|uniref:Uncharacterized protein n=1 Tax=Forsythia ovata TaxID=205694 RepID=A0ABD1R4S1_9LAMI
MEESQNSKVENIPQEEIKTRIEEVEKRSSELVQDEETGEGNSVLETRPSLDSAVKIFVERFTLGDLVKNIADSSYIAQVKEEVEKMVLVSDPWASSVGKDAIYQESEQMKDGISDALIESPLKGTEETTLPTSDETVTENDASLSLPEDVSRDHVSKTLLNNQVLDSFNWLLMARLKCWVEQY